MKKAICIFLSIVMLACTFVLSADATNAQTVTTLQNAVFYSCDYDPIKEQVTVDGTVTHDFMISHANYTIKVVAAPPGSDISTVLANSDVKVLAEATMAVRFTFVVDVSTNIERYSKYAIIFVSNDGEIILADTPKIPSVSSDFEYDPKDRKGFKGFMSESSAEITEVGAGTVVIDICTSKIKGDSSDSIMFPMKDSYTHIRKSYINEIDKKVSSASVADSRVYFRILVDAQDSELAYYVDNTKDHAVPNVYSENVIEYIFTVVSFLTERYGEGDLDGIIVGKKIDDVESVNAIGQLDLKSYSELYSLYLTVVSNAVRQTDSSVDIVIPFSDTSSGSSENTVCTEILLKSILENMNSQVSGDFHCSVLIESDRAPLGITDQSIKDGIDLELLEDDAYISTSSISEIYGLLHDISLMYRNAPNNIIYMWNAPSELSGDALCCSYAYLYKRLSAMPYVSSFVANVGGQYENVRRILKYIDTDKSEKTLEYLSRYFTDTSFLKEQSPVNRFIFETQAQNVAPNSFRGEFVYMDFTSSSVFDRISAGQGCVSVRSGYTPTGVRALCFDTSAIGIGGTAECVGELEFEENYSYTPYLSLKLEIDDKNVGDDAIYEVTLTLGKENARVVASGTVRNRDITTLYFDVSEFSQTYSADHIAVSVRCLTHATNGMSFWIHELKGYSTVYNSDDLGTLIEQARQVNEDDNSDEDGFNYTVIVTVIGILFAIGAVAIGLLMVFKRDDEEKSNE